ncbi:hypothetical protein OH768_02270 [Streptomyces sp. NBC_01622]|uniref:hypothetical protein n=1 Tax=Streptomyces sp. NBC_01622 TaxID=2975903 RepID=UPI003864B3AC|nr:hypothetical protein OH768_02270 [Streptomyces sp. NBC_01622]
MSGAPGVWLSARREAVALAVFGAGFGTYVLIVTAPGWYTTTTTIPFSGAVGGLYLVAGLTGGPDGLSLPECPGTGTASGTPSPTVSDAVPTS